MKSLTNYIKSDKSYLISLSEKLLINKNYDDGYNYHPKDIVELKASIEEHYNKGIYDLNDIDTSEVTNFSELFVGDENTGNKNFDVSKWNVGKGENFTQMFAGCKKFNCDLSKWDVRNSTIFLSMFYNCNEFNSDLSNWNVSKCENFSTMFARCYKFNSDLSDWKVSEGEDFYMMFKDCKNFNSDLSNWNITDNSNTYAMFNNCGIEDKYKPKGVE